MQPSTNTQQNAHNSQYTPRKSKSPTQMRLFGLDVNLPSAVKGVNYTQLKPPCTCHYCKGKVMVVSNASFYGKVYGWPVAYQCQSCKARVGCYDGTDIPKGTLANEQTQKARIAAHAAFDQIWRAKGKKFRHKAYLKLARLLGIKEAHIGWMSSSECKRVIDICASGKIKFS